MFDQRPDPGARVTRQNLLKCGQARGRGLLRYRRWQRLRHHRRGYGIFRQLDDWFWDWLWCRGRSERFWRLGIQGHGERWVTPAAHGKRGADRLVAVPGHDQLMRSRAQPERTVEPLKEDHLPVQLHVDIGDPRGDLDLDRAVVRLDPDDYAQQ